MSKSNPVACSRLTLLVLAALSAASACAGQQRPQAWGAPSADEVANISYRGIEEAGGDVTLQGGSWEGAPYVEGGASRPRVTLAPGPLRTGDLDGDGNEETVVLLASSSGGSGVRSSVAVVGRRHGKPENLATRLLGDRVQLRSMRIDGGKLSIDVVRAGPDDPACCPGELATYSWRLGTKRLEDDRPPTVTGRLSAGVLAGTEWVLRSFAYGDEAPAAPVVTLAFAEAQLSGKAGCNGYFGAFADMPNAGTGALKLGPVGATQMMCPDEAMAVEDRYLRQLGSVSGFGFMNGRLMLSYPDGVMLFDPTGP